MGKQGCGRRLTDKERLEIIALTRENPSLRHAELAVKFNVNESTIRKWRAAANASKVEQRYARSAGDARDLRKRGGAVRNADFDMALHEWITTTMKQGLDVPPIKVRQQARELAERHEGMEGFKASSGWYYRFCRRYGLPCSSAGREESVKAMAQAQLTAGGGTSQLGELSVAGDGSDTLGSSSALPNAVGGFTMLVNSASAAATRPSASAHEIARSLGVPSSSATASDLCANDVQAALSSSAASTSLTQLTASSTPALFAFPTASLPTPGMPPVLFTPSQAAVAHAVHQYKDLLQPNARLRLVRHLTHTPGEAEMYLIMDEETRLEYIKEFVLHPTPAPAAGASADAAVVSESSSAEPPRREAARPSASHVEPTGPQSLTV
ncbi:hypothetical protein P43SY_009613 [Pythium insidiosum]|uniref:HTH CENPB-type domain-containing protein n=1 Tax=Pythium insidiosum TaxID=114742 RepID=A0AAD5LP81_PYTIN|nr:hypothetical protein P43SY_009613 [Pythium insidiosum]